jgi:Mn-dependent DtxR family transcriptional regulator
MSVAQRCEELGYIEKKTDMYRAVKITERGKQYVKRSV